MAQFYVDFNNGNNGDTGANPNPGGGVGPWATLDQFTENARNPGDICTVRRGMGQGSAANLDFTSDGTIGNPIKLEADYDDVWGDYATASETATLVFGSKTVTFAADISGELAAGDWLYETTEDNRLYAYEVDTVVVAVATLFLPYKGNEAGAGKTVEIMPSSPLWNSGVTGNKVNFDTDYYWQLQGIEFTGNPASGLVEINSCVGHVLKDCTMDLQRTDWIVFFVVDDVFVGILDKCRLVGGGIGIGSATGSGEIFALFRNCLIDGEGQAGSRGYVPGQGDCIQLEDCEFAGNGTGDLAHTGDGPAYGVLVEARNCLLTSATPLDRNELKPMTEFHFSDWQGTPGAAENYNSLGDTEGVPNYEADTGTLRVDGSLVSLKVTPSTGLSSAWEFSWLKVLVLELFLTADAHTITVYVKTDDSTEWTADPTVGELWIQAEFLAHATNAHRELVKSTELVDFNGSTAWQPLTVTFTPTQAGDAFLKLYYAKTKEGGKTNEFLVDILPVLS